MYKMNTISATEAKQNFAALLDEAQRHPVIIRRQKRDIAVMVPMKDYEALKKLRADRLQRSMQEASAIAAANGLTDEILQQLLADED